MTTPPVLDLHDIQGGVLRPRPSPYVASYFGLRIDDQAQGRAFMGRLADSVTPVAAPPRGDDTYISVALTCHGLKALGLPQAVIDTFAWEFRQGMAARALALGDVGDNAPEQWEAPLGGDELHVLLIGVAPDTERLEAAIARGKAAIEAFPGVIPVWRRPDCYAPPDEREPFGFRDGISHPAIEGSGVPGDNPLEPPLKAGELVLGYPDETGALPPQPAPEVLGRNGTYVAFRKLHQKVAAFRRYLKDNAADPADEELVAAKMMGRWKSGAPLALCPFHDDPAMGEDKARRNAFGYRDDDAVGYKTPLGSHVRRTNPRDSAVAGLVRLHRMVRRGTAYGPMLAEGVLEDDGADRGLMFAFVGAHLKRQFEFVQSEWINGGEFLGLGDAQDPVCGDGTTTFAIPRKPIPRRLSGMSRFVVTRGGEYRFMPSLSALRWLAGPQAYEDGGGA